MLDAVQAGARRIHPARENPLHLALQRDLVDLDKGVGIGGFRRGTGVAGVGFHPQCTELDGFADILVEIDDAPGDLVEPGKARLLVDDLLRRRLGDDFVAGLQGGRRLRHALGLALARRQSRQRIGARGRDGDALARLRRRYRDRRRRILGNDGGAGRWCQGLRLHRPGRRYALPRQRTIGRRQQPALRQFRHFFFIVGRRLRLAAAGNIAGRARRRLRKDIADLRLRRRRKRERCSGYQGRKTSQGNGSKHLAALTGESGSRHHTGVQALRRAQGLRLTRRIRRGKGGFVPSRTTGQPAPQVK